MVLGLFIFVLLAWLTGMHTALYVLVPLLLIAVVVTGVARNEANK